MIFGSNGKSVVMSPSSSAKSEKLITLISDRIGLLPVLRNMNRVRLVDNGKMHDLDLFSDIYTCRYLSQTLGNIYK